MTHGYISTESCTLMTNLGQVCIFSNLFSILVQWCGFWVGIMGTGFFYSFQYCNLLGDDQKFKRCGDVKKGEDQISKGVEKLFFFFISRNFCHILILFLQICSKIEMPRITLMTTLLF